MINAARIFRKMMPVLIRDFNGCASIYREHALGPIILTSKGINSKKSANTICPYALGRGLEEFPGLIDSF